MSKVSYKVPNPDRIDEMCDAFEDYVAMRPCADEVNMYEPTIPYRADDKDFCGTPGCHAGLFAVLFEDDSASNFLSNWMKRDYFYGIEMMSSFLYETDFKYTQFNMDNKLTDWAMLSGHWPNKYGGNMFWDERAFKKYNGSSLVKIKDIVKTWRKAAKNIRKDKSV